tara:strand:+ start:22 stop:336 length:315 start_codon:yes stop_codon:yes gene_type:complete
MAVISTDKEGYILDLEKWTPEIGKQIASSEGIALTKEHWELIFTARKFYATYEVSPEWRPLVKFTKSELGLEKGNSLYFLNLFPGGSTKLIAKIAGLPRPANCL